MRPIGRDLLRALQAMPPRQRRDALERLSAHLDGFAAWTPYVPEGAWGSHRPACCCAMPGEIAPDGRCSRCWGTLDGREGS